MTKIYSQEFVARTLRSAPNFAGARRATFTLDLGDVLYETFTRYPEPRAFHGPGVVEFVEHADGGIDVMFTVRGSA